MLNFLFILTAYSDWRSVDRFLAVVTAALVALFFMDVALTPASPSMVEVPDKITVKHRQNGFDLLRHIAAITVIFGHAFPLTSHPGPGYLGNGIQTLAVKVFFVASGFLIFRSWQSDPDLSRYLRRRVLRIVPGLIAVTLFCVFILGPGFTTLPMEEYLKNPNTWQFLYNAAFYPVYNLPGVFAANKYPYAVNGSLWTLPVEFALYLLIPIVAGKGLDRARLCVPLTTVFLLVFAVLYIRADPAARHVIYGTDAVSAIAVGVYFMIGAAYSLFRLDRFSRPGLSIALMAAPALLLYNDVAGEILLLLLLPFAVISVGTLHLRFVDRLLRGNDLSYGLYLYAFPVQQAVQAVTHNAWTPRQNFAASATLSALFALLSWNLVEKRALSMKPDRKSVGGG